MTEELKIEKGIPIPPFKNGRKVVNNLLKMDVGDSFFFGRQVK
jgi:hypothetical protein